jgi:tRNA threonylcarbamoyladenosine biosynthesis protein TsaB
VVRAIVLETSGSTSQIALADDGGLVASRRLASERKHARDAIPALKELLASLGWSTSSIELLAVDLGPGSYTGLRVGVAIAKTMAYALNARLVAVDAMTILTHQAPSESSIIAAIVDAQQGRVYASLVRRPLDDARPAVAILRADEWSTTLEPGTYVTGPALLRFRSLVPAGVTAADDASSLPTAESLWTIAYRRHLARQWDDPWTIEPLYLRPSSAQEKWDARLTQRGEPSA